MQSLHASEALQPGFSAVDALSDGDSTVITLRATSVNSPCPSCGVVSGRIHSRSPRRLADLPIVGRRAVLMPHARRSRCEADLCGRRIFAECFDGDILKPWARSTARLDQIVHCLALAVGGRPAASFARRLRCRSATTPCCAPCAGAAAPASLPRRSSGSTTGLGAATIPMER